MNKIVDKQEISADKDSDTRVPEILTERELTASGTDKAAAILSVDLNYEKWSNLFFPILDSTSNVDYYQVRDSRTLFEDRDITVGGYVQIRPAKDMRIFTHKTYEVYLACCRIWRDMDNTTDVIAVSRRQVAQYMGIKRPNKKELESIKYEMMVLSRTTVTWYQMYETKAGDTSGTDWKIFSHFHWDDREQQSHTDRFEGGSVEFQFSKHIVDSVLSRVTSPVNVLVSRSVRTALGKMYYSRLDSIIYKRSTYSNTATTIIRDFDLDPERYKYPSDKKRLCTSLAKQMDGLETSVKGVYIKAEVAEVKPKLNQPKDYKCIFTKTDEPLKKDKKSKTAKTPPKVMETVNDEHDQLVFQEMMANVLDKDRPTPTMVKFSRVYRYEIINGACEEYRRMASNPNIKVANPAGFFTTIVHQQCHLMGSEWIKDCGKECPHRSENQLPF